MNINLEEILEIKYEPEVLSFFLLAPPRSFYIEELVHRLGIKKPKLEPILSKMVTAGQLKTFSKKNKKYYILKPDFEPFPELKNALLKNKLTYIDEFWHAFHRLGNLKAVFLSGIFSGQLDSPIDMLLIGKVSSAPLANFLSGVEKMVGQDINYTVMTEVEFIVRKSSFDRFIKDIFDYSYLVVFDNITNKKYKKV